MLLRENRPACRPTYCLDRGGGTTEKELAAHGYHLGMPHMGMPERVVDLLPGALLIFAVVVLACELSRSSGRDVRTPWALSAVAAIILAKLL